ETGLAGADRAAVGARSRRYGDHSGDWQDQANRLSWRDRYLTRGVAGLERDATRPGRKPPLDATAIERVVNMTLNEKPPGGTHWSLRKMAKAIGLSHSSVQRIWAAHDLKPHLTRSFKLSNDPKFCEKVHYTRGVRSKVMQSCCGFL